MAFVFSLSASGPGGGLDGAVFVPGGRPLVTREEVNEDDSTSVDVSVPTVVPDGWFSATLPFESAMFVGGSFASVIVIVNCSSNESDGDPLSVVRMQIA